MKKSLLGLIGSLALAATTQVHASLIITKNLGTVGVGSYFYDFPDGPKLSIPTGFVDTINFTLGVAGIVNDVITDTDGIVNNSLSLALLDTSKPFSKPVFFCFSNCGATQNFGSLTQGDHYSLIFGGLISGNKGNYADLEGHLNITAVPESSTLAMMFAGFGLLAIYSTRRRSI